MTREELETLLAQVSLGAATPAEEQQLVDYLKTASAEDRALAAQHEALAAALATTLPPAPRRVLDAVERELAAAAPPPARPAVAWYVTTAVAAVAGLLLYFVNDAHQGDMAKVTADAAAQLQKAERQHQQRLSTAVAAEQKCAADKLAIEQRLHLVRDVATLLAHKGTHLVALAPPTPRDESATAIVSPDGKRAILFANHVAPPPGRTYQLWILRGKEPPIAAGFLHPPIEGSAYGEITPDVLAAGLPDAFAISLEPQGGSPTPTEVVLVGKTKS